METFNTWREKIDAALSFYESWRLSDGTPLGLATKSKLLAEAEREEIIASGHHRNVSFYRSLASKLKGEQTLQDAVPLDVAHKLRERAYVDDQASDAA